MATLLFVSPQEIQQRGILGGNVDVDKFNFIIEYVQVSVIEPMLGTELYDKIYDDYDNGTLTGDYLTLFEDYVKPILRHEATGQYLILAQYTVSNAGVFKHAPNNAEVVDPNEVKTVTEYYHEQAQTYIKRFDKWICKNMLPEYKTCQDEVNAQNINVQSGWYFGKQYGKDKQW